MFAKKSADCYKKQPTLNLHVFPIHMVITNSHSISSNLSNPFLIRSTLAVWLTSIHIDGGKDSVQNCRILLSFIVNVIGVNKDKDNYLKTWYSVGFISKHCNMSKTTVYRCLAKLSDLKILSVRKSTHRGRFVIEVLCPDDLFNIYQSCQENTSNTENITESTVCQLSKITEAAEFQLSKETEAAACISYPKETEAAEFQLSKETETIIQAKQAKHKSNYKKDIYTREQFSRISLPSELQSRIDRAIVNNREMLTFCHIPQNSELYQFAIDEDYCEQAFRCLRYAIQHHHPNERTEIATSRLTELKQTCYRRSIALQNCMELLNELSIWDSHTIYAVHYQPIEIWKELSNMNKNRMWGKHISDQIKSRVTSTIYPVDVDIDPKIQQLIQRYKQPEPLPQKRKKTPQHILDERKKRWDQIIANSSLKIPSEEELEQRRKKDEKDRQIQAIFNNSF